VKPVWFTLSVASFLTACGSSDHQEQTRTAATVGALEIVDALAPAPAAPDVASLYFTVINHGTLADTLTAIATSAGGVASLHDMVHVDGAMRMQATGPIAIAPLDTMRMAPGGYHVMMEQISTRPTVGDTLSVTITFSGAGRVDLRVPVLTYSDVARLLEGPGEQEH
jgi:copper(I)-binding protein